MRKIGMLTVVLLQIAVLSASADVISLEPDRDAFVCDCDPGATNPFAGDQFLAQGRISSCYHRTCITTEFLRPGMKILLPGEISRNIPKKAE